MKIVSLECSAVPCSAAIIENGNIIGSAFVNVKLTHSQTLMPLAESLLSATQIDLNQIDGFAISSGPGSFTGLRIGISAVKGMAAADKKPCVGVSTLLAMAHNYIDTDCIICAVMDARCNQVYNALFRIKEGTITRLCEDRAVMIDEVIAELSALDEKIIISGDGAALFEGFADTNEKVSLAEEPLRYQNACGVAFAAEEAVIEGKTLSPDALRPFYLRLPQAERELKAKQLKGE